MQPRHRSFRVVVLAAFACLVGCGGGSHAGSTVPASAGGSVVAQSAKLTITIDTPAKTTSSAHRKPQYVSAATQSLVVNITPQGSTTSIADYPQTVNLTPTSNGCASSLATTQCSLTLSVPVGAYNVTITTYDGANGSGNTLSAAQSVPVTIQPGVANNLGITLGGVPTSAVIVSDAAAITGDTGSGFALATGGSAPVSVFGIDADGNYILGVGAPTVALTSSDTTQFTVSAVGASAPNQFTLTNVTSAAAAAATLTATVTAPSQTGASPLTLIAKLYSQSQLAAPTLTAVNGNAAVAGQVVTVTLTGTNFNVPNTTVHVAGSDVTVVSAAGTSSTSVTAQFSVSAAAMPESLQVSVTTPAGTSLVTRPFFVVPLTGVTRFDDTVPGSPAGTGTGALGDLRYAMLHASPGATLTFPDCNACVVALRGPLPPITQNLSIDGTGQSGEATLDEGSAYRMFFVDSGTVAIRNLQLQNVVARGGNAGGGQTSYFGGYYSNAGNGGGGAGLGAAVFINQAGANVSITNVTFSGCTVIGGAAPAVLTLYSSNQSGANGGGGGGLGGNASTAGNVAGAGGGVLAPAVGANGGYGGGAAASGGSAGTPFAGDPGANGHIGGFGGGGAGGDSADAGAGGFGAGGGGAEASQTSGPGGTGGPGGGGGGGSSWKLNLGSQVLTHTSAGGAGGSLGAISGGGGGDGGGGGGAAAGPAIFVNAGTLTISGSSATKMTATGGNLGYAYLEPTETGEAAGGSDATPVYNYAGTVNGSTTNGPVSTAVSTSAVRRGGR